jgi:hypothetical protein
VWEEWRARGGDGGAVHDMGLAMRCLLGKGCCRYQDLEEIGVGVMFGMGYVYLGHVYYAALELQYNGSISSDR